MLTPRSALRNEAGRRGRRARSERARAGRRAGAGRAPGSAPARGSAVSRRSSAEPTVPVAPVSRITGAAVTTIRQGERSLRCTSTSLEARLLHPGADLRGLEVAAVAPGVEEQARDRAVLGHRLARLGPRGVADHEHAAGPQRRVGHTAQLAVALLGQVVDQVEDRDHVEVLAEPELEHVALAKATRSAKPCSSTIARPTAALGGRSSTVACEVRVAAAHRHGEAAVAPGHVHEPARRPSPATSAALSSCSGRETSNSPRM